MQSGRWPRQEAVDGFFPLRSNRRFWQFLEQAKPAAFGEHRGSTRFPCAATTLEVPDNSCLPPCPLVPSSRHCSLLNANALNARVVEKPQLPRNHNATESRNAGAKDKLEPWSVANQHAEGINPASDQVIQASGDQEQRSATANGLLGPKSSKPPINQEHRQRWKSWPVGSISN